MSDPTTPKIGRLARLQHCHAMGVHYREQMEAMAAECCQIFDIDPKSDSVERDWCDEIVTGGRDPHEVYAMIIGHRRKRILSARAAIDD